MSAISKEDLEKIEEACLALVDLGNMSEFERKQITNGDEDTYADLEASMAETFGAMNWDGLRRPERD